MQKKIMSEASIEKKGRFQEDAKRLVFFNQTLATITSTINRGVLFAQVVEVLEVPFEKPFSGPINTFNNGAYSLYSLAVTLPGKAFTLIPAKAVKQVPGIQYLESAIGHAQPAHKFTRDVIEVAGPLLAKSVFYTLDKLTKGATDLSGLQSIVRQRKSSSSFTKLHHNIRSSLDRDAKIRGLDGNIEEVKSRTYALATRITEPVRLLQGAAYTIIDGAQGYASWKQVSIERAANIAEISGYPLISMGLNGAQMAVNLNTMLQMSSSILNFYDVVKATNRVHQVGLGSYSLEEIKTIVLANTPEFPTPADWEIDSFDSRAQVYGAALEAIDLPAQAAELTEKVISNLCNASAKSAKLIIESVGPTVSGLVIGAKYYEGLPNILPNYPAPDPLFPLAPSTSKPIVHEHFDAVGMAVTAICSDICLHLGLHLASKITAPFFSGVAKQAIRSQLSPYEAQIRTLIEQQIKEKLKGYLFNVDEIAKLDTEQAKTQIQIGAEGVELFLFAGKTTKDLGKNLYNLFYPKASEAEPKNTISECKKGNIVEFTFDSASKALESAGEATMSFLEDPIKASYNFTLFAAKGANSILSNHFASGKKRDTRLMNAAKLS
ncbi:hypothetical protein ACD661_11820 [Legionella lytica]|uniref:Uncharacterized protein n=1 Tax=Legionella lytica TaxID=96232 RepID=A0ABW8D970_9GAMM